MTSLLDLSSELILRICSDLNDDVRAVARLRQTNRRLYALAGDTMLWKQLFTYAFLVEDAQDTHHLPSRPAKRRRADSHESASSERRTVSARKIVTLPFMSAEERDSNDQRIDWYALYKISHNWQTGNYSAHHLRTALNASSALANSTDEATTAIRMPTRRFPELPDTIVEASSDFVFTASRRRKSDSTEQQVLVFPTSVLSDAKDSQSEIDDIQQMSLAAFTSTQAKNSSVSALAVDRSHTSEGDTMRLLVAFSSGELSIASYHGPVQRFEETAFMEATSGSCSADAVVMAAFHWPIIATCTVDFRIRIYRASPGRSRLDLLEERRSYSCHWPACLRLEPLPRVSQSAGATKLGFSIAYCSPVYPTGWSVGLQEMILLDDNGVIDSRSASAKRSHVVTRIDSPPTKASKDKRTLGDKDRTDQLGRLTSMSYEHPFVVVGTRDNDVYCFRVEGSIAHQQAAYDSVLSVQHVRTLHGHTGTVNSVSLNGGRCVTGGSDGSVRVWRLGDEERSIARATGLLATLEGRLRRSGDRGDGSVVTLQTTRSSVDNRKRKRFNHGATIASGNANTAKSAAFTLADIVRHARHTASLPATMQQSSSSVIRWVASAFDRIISVSAVGSTNVHSLPCRQEAAEAPNCGRDEEQVQIWSFSA